jgi:hypothetical protein
MKKQFVVGQTYATRSICDYDTVYRFKIVARTAKQLTFEQHGAQKRRGIYVYEGVEQFKPYGTYSMCAIVGADDLVEEQPQ